MAVEDGAKQVWKRFYLMKSKFGWGKTCYPIFYAIACVLLASVSWLQQQLDWEMT